MQALAGILYTVPIPRFASNLKTQVYNDYAAAPFAYNPHHYQMHATRDVLQVVIAK